MDACTHTHPYEFLLYSTISTALIHPPSPFTNDLAGESVIKYQQAACASGSETLHAPGRLVVLVSANRDLAA